MANNTSKKAPPKPQYVNKVHEVYHYIETHPDRNDKEIIDALKHMSSPAVHISLKSLNVGGYVLREETDELNKLGRRMGRYKVVPSKPYEPKFSRAQRTSDAPSAMKSGTSEGGVGALKSIPHPRRQHRVQEIVSTKFTDIEPHLTIPTMHGPIDLTIPQAKSLYNELKKLFETT